MKHFTWNEYYENFYDWSFGTQKQYSYGLLDYGPAEEVAELAQELAASDETFAVKFVEKAMAAGVRFAPDQIAELASFTGEALAGRLVEAASRPFDREELEDICGLVDDGVFDQLCQKSGIDFFDDEGGEEVIAAKPSKPVGTLIDWDPEKDLPERAGRAGETGRVGHMNPKKKPKKKPGFFSGLAAAVGTSVLLDKAKPDRSKGRCSGDCANCPPHYGYRYGRWYYGHGHQYGCEFGGNSGDGSL